MRHRRIGIIVLGGLATTGLAVTGLAATGPTAAASAATVIAAAATPAAATPAAATPVAAAAVAPHGTISTIAGGTGGPAAATSVSIDPCAIKYANGSLYFGTGDNSPSAVYRVSQRTGVLTPVAGSGITGGLGANQPGDGTLASAFTFSSPCGVAADGAGNVLVADSDQAFAVAAKTGTFYGQRMTAGRVYTVASGYSQSGAMDVQRDSVGNLVITLGGQQASHTNAETYAQVLVKARQTGTFYGHRMVKGQTYEIAGGPRGGGPLPGPPFGPDRTGPASASPTVGVRAGQADLGYLIGAVRFDAAGNIVLADGGGDGGGPFGGGSDVSPQVRVIPLRSGTFYHRAMKVGYIYTIAGGGAKTPDGVPAASSALSSAAGVAIDNGGNVLIADSAVRVIAARSGTFYGRKMAAGDIYTLKNLPAADTVAVDNVGNVLLGGENHVYLLAAKTGSFYGKQARAGGVYTVAGNGRVGYSGDGGPATRAEFGEPVAVAANGTGTLTAVPDLSERAVRVIAVTGGRHFGRAMRNGFVYTVAGGGTRSSSSGGVPGPSVALDEPNGVAFDRAGNLVFSDGVDHRIHVVANSSGVFYGRTMVAGDIYTVAGTGAAGSAGDGGSALAATLEGPLGVAVDKNGNVLLIDSEFGSSYRIRIVADRTGTFYGRPMAAGDIYPLAGTGTPGYSGDGGPATAAEIQAQAIAVDPNGNLVILDGQGIRVVAATAGTFYGRAMTAGDIYTVYTVGGTPGTQATLSVGAAVAIDQAGNLLIDGGNAVWMVAEKAGTYYGKAMRAGNIYAVAQSAAGGLVFLDGIPATRALFGAVGIAVQLGTENLLIADNLSARVRSVSR
jgi:hypothetical protein